MSLALFGAPPTLTPDAHRSWPEVVDTHRQAAARVLDRGVFSGGTAPETVAFEREFASFAGVRHALLTHSGTSALHMALTALDIGAGDHVVVPAYSFVATPLAVLHTGAIPIFADVDADTGLMRARDVAEVLTPRTRAIVPVHVHGCAAELEGMSELAERHRLSIVEDAAQAHGATRGGRPVGGLGQAGAFSLQSSKNLGVGEGGVFVTNDERLAEAANRVRNFGQNVRLADRDAFDATRPLDSSRALESGRIGWMYRGNEHTAALARASLERLPVNTAACQANAERLSRALADLPGVSPPHVPSGSTSVHHKYRVRLDPQRAGLDVTRRTLRDLTIRALRAEGLHVVLWQDAPLPAQPVFQNRDGYGGGWPWSSDPDTNFATLYDVARFERTQRLLDGSIVLFSQSCPLIAQTAETVDRYAEAFARVWAHRRELVALGVRDGRAGGSGG